MMAERAREKLPKKVCAKWQDQEPTLLSRMARSSVKGSIGDYCRLGKRDTTHKSTLASLSWAISMLPRCQVPPHHVLRSHRGDANVAKRTIHDFSESLVGVIAIFECCLFGTTKASGTF